MRRDRLDPPAGVSRTVLFAAVALAAALLAPSLPRGAAPGPGGPPPPACDRAR